MCRNYTYSWHTLQIAFVSYKRRKGRRLCLWPVSRPSKRRCSTTTWGLSTALRCTLLLLINWRVVRFLMVVEAQDDWWPQDDIRWAQNMCCVVVFTVEDDRFYFNRFLISRLNMFYSMIPAAKDSPTSMSMFVGGKVLMWWLMEYNRMEWQSILISRALIVLCVAFIAISEHNMAMPLRRSIDSDSFCFVGCVVCYVWWLSPCRRRRWAKLQGNYSVPFISLRITRSSVQCGWWSTCLSL